MFVYTYTTYGRTYTESVSEAIFEKETGDSGQDLEDLLSFVEKNKHFVPGEFFMFLCIYHIIINK